MPLTLIAIWCIILVPTFYASKHAGRHEYGKPPSVYFSSVAIWVAAPVQLLFWFYLAMLYGLSHYNPEATEGAWDLGFLLMMLMWFGSYFGGYKLGGKLQHQRERKLLSQQSSISTTGKPSQ
ncbi:MAG: hypothetical protein Q8S09_00815 [Hyphomonas sp.]|nr:hypothetical protein [Hyphomonas sp.]